MYCLKVDMPYALTCFDWTTMVEWNVGRRGSKNGYQNDVHLEEVESRV